jgi:hypothetical protein
LQNHFKSEFTTIDKENKTSLDNHHSSSRSE